MMANARKTDEEQQKMMMKKYYYEKGKICIIYKKRTNLFDNIFQTYHKDSDCHRRSRKTNKSSNE